MINSPTIFFLKFYDISLNPSFRHVVGGFPCVERESVTNEESVFEEGMKTGV